MDDERDRDLETLEEGVHRIVREELEAYRETVIEMIRDELRRAIFRSPTDFLNCTYQGTLPAKSSPGESETS